MDIVAKNIKGLFARGAPDECPPDKVLVAKNLMNRGPNLVPRPPADFAIIGNQGANKSHISIHKPLPVAGVLTPVLIAQNLALAPGSNITEGIFGNLIFSASKNYHSWITFFGRGYFTIHDTKLAATLDVVQVYDRTLSLTSRNAAGLKPVSVMAGVRNAAAGNLSVGIYLFDVCYITNTGFTTQPAGHIVQVSCFGSDCVDLSNIPTGPAGTVSRQIVCTKAINLSLYTGNPGDYEFFLPAAGLISNNVATTLTITFFDGNLRESANPLSSLLSTIPCGIGIGEFNNRMLVWGEAANPSIVRVSNIGEPESFDSVSGIIVVDPTESGGVTNVIAFNGQLYIFKATRMFVASDNGSDPASWDVVEYDGGVGTQPYGISEVLDSEGKHLNQFLIASKQGIMLFDGVVRTPELTYWIEDIWKDIDPTKFSTIQIAINPLNHQIYCILPRNGNIYQILVGDFSDGLNPDTIKWYLWDYSIGFAQNIYSLTIMTNSDGTITLYFSTTIQINISNPDLYGGKDQGGTASYICTLQSRAFTLDETWWGHQINEVRVRGLNLNTTDITAQGISADDASRAGAVITLPFTNSPGKYQEKMIKLTFSDSAPTVSFTIKADNSPRISKIFIGGDVWCKEPPV